MKTWTTPAGTVTNLCLDILSQPHVLIAGTTGSGKSVLMNSIIYTALHKAPSEACFILIDPKGTELYKYRQLPHTLAYIDTPAAAVKALSAVLDEIQQRNDRARRKGREQSNEADVYIFIDELGDLIFTDHRAAQLLGRIAMIGRSARIHLIAGTQCPNRKTLSPEFAANCPARVGLRCRDKIESRQIIGNNNAVTLPMHGTGYYLAPQLMEPEAVTIPFTSAEEIQRIITHWMNQTRRHWWQR